MYHFHGKTIDLSIRLLSVDGPPVAQDHSCRVQTGRVVFGSTRCCGPAGVVNLAAGLAFLTVRPNNAVDGASANHVLFPTNAVPGAAS
jgi:hypothetical protein